MLHHWLFSALQWLPWRQDNSSGMAALSLFCIGGAGIGILIGIFFMKMHRLLPTDANIDIVLTLVTPFLISWAEELHASGVLIEKQL